MIAAIIFTLWSLVVIGTAPDKPIVTGVVTHDFGDVVLCNAVAKEMVKQPSIVRAKCFPK